MNKLLVLFSVLSFNVLGQSYAPAPGEIGSTAIYKDSSIIVSWASAIDITRGPMNIQNIAAGEASFGVPEDALGPADGTLVVSLGDGGSALLTFNDPIVNGVGPDFAIFENGFTDHYMEFAFVEVSSDGLNFYRFNAVSETPTDVQISNFDFSDCRYINNLAGKYRANYGTPFDLQELAGSPELDINNVTFIRIIDVVGSIEHAYGTMDFQGNIINDPFPTEFNSGGFDLDAVGVIHQQELNIDEHTFSVNVYPNPTIDKLVIESEFKSEFVLKDCKGRKIYNENFFGKKELDLTYCVPGVYFLEIQSEGKREIIKIIKNG